MSAAPLLTVCIPAFNACSGLGDPPAPATCTNTVQDGTGLPVGGWEMRDIDNSPSPLNVDNPAYYYLYGPADAGPTGVELGCEKARSKGITSPPP